MTQDWLHTLAEAQAGMPAPPERPWLQVIANGSMYAGLYAPRGEDDQKPHDKDELYVVVAGSGTFLSGDDRRPFAPGDLIFVPAGLEHRFESFSDDLAVWAIFWGPSGGETPA